MTANPTHLAPEEVEALAALSNTLGEQESERSTDCVAEETPRTQVTLEAP